ncbi:hypothetical protein [Pedobacter roseus]|uniref:Uncharacterized protein n=1 Tax=Pedobacter roseus TaxID=336820 RepID=A0A7G9QDT1_9SPHI|nr:hypothetical protein [Pedobacter roseus]QNN41506.1 hypothetical protein H9L23_20730 [Pedobacter roseus]
MLKFQKLIDRSYFRVDDPDHPFAYSGPDILLSDAGQLTGLFIPTPEEQNSSNKLLLRLMNAKIAYPATTVMTLVLEPDTKLEYKGQFDRDFFDLVVEPGDLKKLKSILRETKPSHSLKEFKHTQKQLYVRQSNVQINNLNYIAKVEFSQKRVTPFAEEERLSYYNYLEQKTEKVRSNIYYFEESLVGFKKLTTRPDLVELAPYYDFVLRSELYMQDKIPVFKERFMPKCLSLNELPTSKSDPSKPMRLASLFGWLIGNINTRRELQFRLGIYE